MSRIQLNEDISLSRIIAGVMNWGVWGANLSVNEVQSLVAACVDIGITTFDHADIYGHYTTEALFGEAIKASSIRTKMQLITKCGIKLVTPNRPEHRIKSYDTSKAHILASVEQSLQNLHTDYIDVLLIHRPSPLMHPEEIAEAFSILKKEGKVRAFGVSNFTTTQFEMLHQFVPLVTNQIKTSVLYRDAFTDSTLDQCIKQGINPMGYAPLAGGQLFSSDSDETLNRIRQILKELSQKYKAGIDQILLAWLLKHPSKILPVVGSSKITRIQAAYQALTIDLTREEWFMIWEAAEGKEVA
ncbi:aldo/keto reductase [Aquimarina rhabdastrellae]